MATLLGAFFFTNLKEFFHAQYHNLDVNSYFLVLM